MKVRRYVVKAGRSCDDDWDEDEAPQFYTGATYELSDDAPRFRSVSPAAHRAIHTKPATTIGFHKPRTNP